MGRRIDRLTLDNLDELPGGCSSCLFWERDPVERERVRGHEGEEKAAWVSEVLREWGSCGRVLYVEDSPVGHALYAPPAYLPGAQGFATAPVGSDAVLLSTVYVHPAHRGVGLGRVLVQAVAADLITRGGIRAVEAFGDTRGCGHELGRSCTVPADFLLGVGFRTQRAHARHPRMRMDLRSTVTWREELEGALDRLLAGIRHKAPAPTPTGHRSGARSTSREGPAPSSKDTDPLTPTW